MTISAVNAQQSGFFPEETAASAGLGQLAAAGNIDAQFRLGIAYVTGRGLPLDLQKARFWFEKAAKGGHVGAEQQLYSLNDHSNASPKSAGTSNVSDEMTTTAGLEQLAAAGNIDAQFRLGIAYVTGRGVPLDTQKAKLWFEKAAEGGHVGAEQQLLGLAVQSAASVATPESNHRDYKSGANTEAKLTSAESDDYRPSFNEQQITDVHRAVTGAVLNNKLVNVSGYTRDGNYVSSHTRQPPGGITFGDKVEANLIGFAVVAALAGIDYGLQKWDNYTKKKNEVLPSTKSEEQTVVGSADGYSQGVAASMTDLERDASAGDIDAQFRLGIAFVTGRGMPLDTKRAKSWFEKAAARGHVGAKQQLFGLSNSK